MIRGKPSDLDRVNFISSTARIQSRGSVDGDGFVKGYSHSRSYTYIREQTTHALQGLVPSRSTSPTPD